jgi:predicted ATP-dependent endonuclease of OLD family
MIKINKLEIFNYRSCIKTKVETSTPLTTLIGINGVGKSNILNSIQLLQKINRNRYFHQRQLIETLSHSRLNLELDIDSTIIILKADIYYDTDESNTDEIYSAELKYKNLNLKNRKWTEIDSDLYEYIDYTNRATKPIDVERFFSHRKKNIEESKISLRLISYLTNISYYSATQFSDPTKSPISLELEDSRLGRSYRKSQAHEKFLFDLYRYHKSDKKMFDRYINTVNQNGIGLIDDIKFLDHQVPNSSYKVKAGGQIQKIEKIKTIIIPSIILDKLTLSPNQLSEGTFKTLALIFYILNDESDLLLIEEPEVCVHHGLLSSIIELIKIQSKKKQIIISTHSDYVLDKLNPENVVLVKKTKGQGTQASTLSKTLTKNDFKALKDYLEQTGNLGEYWKEGGFENE